MAIQDNVAKLVIGDNLYIVDKEVTDYWWDGTNRRVPETEFPDMNNVIITLDVATGGSNAITDILIDGNSLKPTKNTMFVNAGNDQSITWMRTFTSTIISNVIQYSGEDGSFLLLNSDNTQLIETYSKSEDDALLLLKVDKIQFIDSCAKTETNNLLNSMSDIGVSYTKSEDDTLLLAKADNIQLIDSFTKTETSNLLNNKIDSGVSSTKDEDDTLLLAKAEKT
ncbi:MAG: hypothetical protein EZS28_009421 [Streblomastix strix]|uniref:Uncharacterized protein n=1 Tax=Streblomastix strix TaxID=222440 RepID=A0A5J4WJU6_9EUKA|nr:MAG: hypothetical protein EZS28_009421 [Streblomastix strix]